MSRTPPAPRYRIRAAAVGDATDVAWLAALTFPMACPATVTHEDAASHIARHLSPRQFTEWIASPKHQVLVAERAPGDSVGYALVDVAEAADLPPSERMAVARAAGSPGPFIELSKIYVRPDELGSGLAGELMKASIAAARRLAADHQLASFVLFLGTNAGNYRARRFYEKHGFRVIGERTFTVGSDTHHDVVMHFAA